MPIMDGVGATRQIMLQSPCAIIIVTATVEGNAAKVVEALGAGALDAIQTPTLSAEDHLEKPNALLIKKIDAVGNLISGNEKRIVGRIQVRMEPRTESISKLERESRRNPGVLQGGPQMLWQLCSSLCPVIFLPL